jgi:DNA-binding MarR family transcriptional regulator
MSVLEWVWIFLCGGLALYALLILMTDRSLSTKEAAVLWVLQQANERGIYATDICDITGIGRSSIYPMLARLEDRGLVRYTIDEINRRNRYHFITEEARRQIDEAIRREAEESSNEDA